MRAFPCRLFLAPSYVIGLSFGWLMYTSLQSTSCCYSLTLSGCQSGPMLFPALDVVALTIMTFLLVSSACRSVPEDTAPPSWMSQVSVMCPSPKGSSSNRKVVALLIRGQRGHRMMPTLDGPKTHEIKLAITPFMCQSFSIFLSPLYASFQNH